MLGNLFFGKTFPSTVRVTAAIVLTLALSSGCARGPRLQSRTLLNDFSHLGQRAPERPHESAKLPSSAPNSPVVAAREESAPDEQALSDAGRASIEDLSGNSDDLASSASKTDDGQESPEASNDERVVARIVSAADDNNDSRVRQLRAALSLDEQRGHTNNSLAITPPLRLRVDSLLRKAGDLLTAGKLLDARQSALRAAELTESAGLEFLPTEERPTDMLRQIDDQIELTRQTEPDALTAGAARVSEDSEVPFSVVPDASTSPHPNSDSPNHAERPPTVDNSVAVELSPILAMNVVELSPGAEAGSSEPTSSESGTESAGNGIRPFRGTVDSAESSSAPNPRVPNPPQIHEVGVLPQFSPGESDATASPAQISELAPVSFTLDGSLVWPIGGFLGIFVVFGTGLLIRSLTERIRTAN